MRARLLVVVAGGAGTASLWWSCVGRAGKHVRAALEDLVRVLAVDQVEQLAVAVEVVEVLEQPEVEGLLDVRVRLGAREVGRQLDRDLLEPDGGLEHALVGRIQPVDGVLLLVLDAPERREHRLEVRIVATRGRTRARTRPPRSRCRSSG